MTNLRRLGSNQRGATAIEYAIVAGLIGLGLVGVLTGTRASLNQDFNCVGARLNGGTASCVVPKFDPATPLGQAAAMMPASVALNGMTHSSSGADITWATYNGSINVAMVINGNWVWFSGTPIAPGVWQVTSALTGVDTAAGQKAYFVGTPSGLIMVNGTPT
jgi:Flp pilus assembly pilin Flp